MKIKDLSKDTELIGLRVKINKQEKLLCSYPSNSMVIKSGWNGGLWLTDDSGSDKIYHYTGDIMELEIEEDN